jgi:hypothetical protein
LMKGFRLIIRWHDAAAGILARCEVFRAAPACAPGLTERGLRCRLVEERLSDRNVNEPSLDGHNRLVGSRVLCVPPTTGTKSSP